MDENGSCCIKLYQTLSKEKARKTAIFRAFWTSLIKFNACWTFSGAANVFWLLRFERFPEAIITQNRTFYNHSGKSFHNFSQNPRGTLLLFCFLSTAAQGCGGSVKDRRSSNSKGGLEAAKRPARLSYEFPYYGDLCYRLLFLNPIILLLSQFLTPPNTTNHHELFRSFTPAVWVNNTTTWR